MYFYTQAMNNAIFQQKYHLQQCPKPQKFKDIFNQKSCAGAYTPKTIKHCWQKLKKTYMNGQLYHIHGSEHWIFFPNWSRLT